MSYTIFDVEVTQPLPTLSLSDERTGMAVLLRRKGRPISFWMEEQVDNGDVTQAELKQKIHERAGRQLLHESVYEDLVSSPVESDQFPSLTIAVCTKDRPAQLARCLDSLETVQCSHCGRLELLVIDNAPSDAQTRQHVDDRSGVRYVSEPKPGLGFARNRALEEATGELLAFVDDDVVVDSHWLNGLQEAWTENPDAAAFTGLVLPLELKSKAQIIFEESGGFCGGLRSRFKKVRYEQSDSRNSLYPCNAGIFGAGANMTFRREVLLEMGGFDEALDTGRPLPGGGDLDIFYRVIRAGYPLVYEPRYMVFHQHRRNLQALRRQYWGWGLSFMAFLAKSHQNDPSHRPKIRRLIGWWFKYQFWQTLRGMAGRHELPVDMLLAELSGGVVGLLGEYSRSKRRVERIREQYK